MNITFVKGSNCYNHVRVLKFIEYFKQRNIKYQLTCWLREESLRSPFNEEVYIFHGGGFGGKKLAFFYPIWMVKLFIHVVNNSYPKDHLFFAIDFDTALPIYIASLIKRDVKYIYDIHDDFAKRYRFPKLINKGISLIDSVIKKGALKTIHVDDNRVAPSDKNYIIIYNSPKDYFHGKFNKPQLLSTKTFCVSGLLSEARGIRSLYEFATKNKSIKFIVAGQTIDEIAKNFTNLENVTYLGIVDQTVLFDKIKDCHGIFSLYDPSLEINRLAASNKLYDAIMLGIPVIVNKGIVAENIVREKKIGFVIEYSFDETWDKLLAIDNETYSYYGQNGRILYEECYSYSINLENKLDKLIENLNVI